MLGWEIFAAARAVVHQPFVAPARGQRLPLELQRDGPADLGVARAINVAEDAFANALEQVVVRDGTEHRSDGRSYFCGFDGRSSMRLGRLLAGICRRSITTWATSSGWIFQPGRSALLRPRSRSRPNPASRS
jgi:hypothetical protein